MIERDPEHARELAEALAGTTVLNNNATDREFLDEEHIGEADAMVAALGSDEKNLLTSLLASRLGVDLGVANLAVTSTGIFISGDELTHWQNEYEQRRASMQQTGTHWAHRDMQRVGRKEEGRFTVMLHEASNALVDEAEANDCPHITFGNLEGIRERLPWATWQHRWAFRKLYEFVSYKAVARGISVRQVNPKNTSRQCSRTDCGFTYPDNRPQTNGQDEFCCLKCDYEVHADYNVLESEAFQWSGNLRFPSTTKNIAVKYAKNLHRLHKSSDGGAPVDVPLNSGLLTVEGTADVSVG